jgi:hypothetical protein
VAGGHTVRAVIVGKSGFGKSTYARGLIEYMRDRGLFTQLCVVSTKQEDYIDLCNVHVHVTEDGDPEGPLKRGDVFFWITGLDPRPFMDRLGQAIMQRRGMLIVLDEAHNYLTQSKMPKGFYQVFTAGRALGHNMLVITQALTSADFALATAVLKQASHLVSFQLSEQNEVSRFAQYVPQAADLVTQLKRPDEVGTSEFVVKFKDRSQAGVVLADDFGKQVFYPL